jgi:hypothetical protein
MVERSERADDRDQYGQENQRDIPGNLQGWGYLGFLSLNKQASYYQFCFCKTLRMSGINCAGTGAARQAEQAHGSEKKPAG